MRTTRLRGLAAALAVAIGGLTLLQTAPAQATAPLKWAVSDGSSMTRNSGATGFTKLGPGRYEVTFGANVSQCAYVASTHVGVGGGQAQTVFTAGGHSSPNGVYVETKNQGGGLSDAPFSLFVSCDDTGAERHAVVDTSGNLNRGSAGTTVANLGGGRYKVHFNRKANNCTAIATVGDPANGLVFNPAGVYTSSVAGDVNGVYVETKNPGGGLTAGIPFHLALICNNPHFTRVNANADGTPQRASTRTSSFRTGTGAYTVVGASDLTNCAWLTTRGEPRTNVPFNPTTVEAAAGPAANTVTISEKSLLFFGGAPASEAFQFVAAC